MNFNLGVTTGAKEVGSVLSAGIHNATFQGISKSSVNGKDGSVYDVMALKLDIENYGEFTHNFFEPTNSERTESQFGPNPSQVEHFLIAVRQILDALDPKIGESVDTGETKISGSFSQIINIIKKLTDPHIGKNVQIKLLPGNNGFASISSFPARINRQGALGIAVKFIGHDLTLTANELKKIEAAKNAKPTNMAAKEKTNLLADISAELDSDNDDSDLPF